MPVLILFYNMNKLTLLVFVFLSKLTFPLLYDNVNCVLNFTKIIYKNKLVQLKNQFFNHKNFHGKQEEKKYLLRLKDVNLFITG